MPGQTHDEADSRTLDPEQALAGLESALAAEERELRRHLGLGANDLVVLRLLLDAESAGDLVRPSEISHTLEISTAATTALIDRLESRGYLQRRPHETDRRSIRLTATIAHDSAVRIAFEAGRNRRARTLRALPDGQQQTTAAAFRALEEALTAAK